MYTNSAATLVSTSSGFLPRTLHTSSIKFAVCADPNTSILASMAYAPTNPPNTAMIKCTGNSNSFALSTKPPPDFHLL